MSQLKLYGFIAIFCSLILIGQSEVALPNPSSVLHLPKNSDDLTKDNKLGIDFHPVSTVPNYPEIETTVNDKRSTPTTTTTPTTTKTTTPASTTSTKPSTSTPVPPPPTTPEPNPSPKPGPPPPPETGTWYYSFNNTNKSCIIVQFAAQLNLTYTKNGINGSADEAYLMFNVPVNATVVEGDCSVSEQKLKMSWLADSMNNNSRINLTMVFQSNSTTHTYDLHYLNVSMAPMLFVNSSLNSTVELYHINVWKTPLATSYRCNAPTKISLSADNTIAGDLMVSHLQEEAFRNTTEKAFSAARDCPSGDVPDAVPIAVGCALGGLVLVVLIAYLVGRRRSASRGYLSM